MDLPKPISQAEAQRALLYLMAAACKAPPIPQPQVQGLSLQDLLIPIHGYWKSKVHELHRYWKEVTDEIDINELDTRTQNDAEKEYEGHKMPIFKLGDRVRIIGSDMRLYKILHKNVGIWRAELKQLIGKEAIVMNLSSYSAVGIALIENGNMYQINGYALEKIDNYSEEGIWANDTGFLRNEEVVIGVDDFVLDNLQINSRTTPFHIAVQLKEYIGRVMCCYQEEVVVTFDEIRHETLNPAALRRYDADNKKKFTKPTQKDDLRVGTKVRVKSDGDKVMELQRGHGEWSYKMTRFVGKEGVIIDNKENADVIVKFTPFESYRMNRNALEYGNKKARDRNKSGSASFGTKPFVVGDILQLNVAQRDLGSTFQLLRIPKEFSSVIIEHFTFVGYRDHKIVRIDMGYGPELIAGIQDLKKIKNQTEIIKVKEADKAIKVGSKVQLFIGPKCYVKKILKIDFKPGFEKALDHLGTIVGYDKSGNAVITYDDDKLYSVPDEYLCSPREIWNRVQEEVSLINLEKEVIHITSPGSVSALEAKVLNVVSEVLEKSNEPDAGKWTAKTRGGEGESDPRMIAVSFPILPKDFEAFAERLKDALTLKNCTLEKGEGDRSFTVCCDDVNFQLIFCEEGSNEIDLKQVHKTTKEDTRPPPPIFGRSISTSHDVISEPQTAGNAAVPFITGSVNVPIPVGVSQVVLQIGATGRQQQSQAVHAPPAANQSIVIQGGSPTINMSSDVRDNTIKIQGSSLRSIHMGK